MSGYWVVQAQRFSATGYGSKKIPIFYLHENVQGILTEHAAKRIALDLLRTAADDDYAEFFIHAEKVD